jgi:hypothetical protein
MLFVFLLINLIVICSSQLVLKPNNGNDISIVNEAGLIIIQGAGIDSANYKQFATDLQSKFSGKLWVSVPQFILSTPQPLQISQKIYEGIDSLTKAGLNINKDMPFFFVGHSLGGIMLQDFILDQKNVDKLPVKVAGLILEGSYITRSNRDKLSNANIPNILTIGGELDGVNRITRMVEAYYFDKQNPRFSNFEIMTLIVKGVNHYQFAGEDGSQPPSLVKQHDIQAEISDSEARDKLTSLLNSFIRMTTQQSDGNDKSLIQSQLDYTAELLNPLIEGFLLEGNYHFNPPCYQYNTTGCSKSCPWMQTALEIMATPQVKVRDINIFRPVQNLPPSLPAIANNCSVPYDCILNCSTIVDNIYDSGESFDTSLQPIAAGEMRAKFSSRQNLLYFSSGKLLDFVETDGSDICADINNYSLEWALKNSPAITVQRYMAKGKKLVMGPDNGSLDIGPLWIWTPLVNIYKFFAYLIKLFKCLFFNYYSHIKIKLIQLLKKLLLNSVVQ